MIIDEKNLPYGFKYPKEFLKIIKLELLDFEVWHMFKYSSAEFRLEGLKQRYPEYKLIPFARRGDNDDVACFEAGKNDTVIVIHDFSDNAYENRREYKTFWCWFEEIIHEMINYD